MKKIDCTKALHEIIESVRQLTYMKQHSERLCEFLNVKLERTYAMAPLRGQSYELGRKERPDPNVRERLLEKAIWKQWCADEVSRRGKPFLSGVCRCVQTYQMPLQKTRGDRKWGKIDLVGVTDKSCPVVIELKQDRGKDTPLRMLVEGVAYAVAVRRAWNEGRLREQWERDVVGITRSHTVAPTLVEVPVVLLAPEDYWKRCVGTQGKRTEGKVREDAWSPFQTLARKCGEHGLPVTFAQFDITDSESGRLPEISNLRRVRLPH
jgi:hypothetical protein